MNVISDTTKFQQITSDIKKLTIKLEDKVNYVLKSLKSKGSISESFYNSCYSSGSQLGILYGLPKVHKQNIPIRPILSACTAHNFTLGKHLIPIVEQLSHNEYMLRNSYEFVDSIKSVPNADKQYMCSFDVESLYTNVPVTESIELILNRIYIDNVKVHHGFTRKELKKLLELTLQDTYFKFNNSIYKQLDGLAMGSSLSPIIANIFLNDFETKHLNNCPAQFRPTFYRRYLDDTFILFDTESNARSFLNYFNSKHETINFTFEGETSDRSISFLDVNITRFNNEFQTSVYRKPTFTGLGTNFFSNIFDVYKTNAIRTLIYRAYCICSTYLSFHNEMLFLRSYFVNNGYPSRLFESILSKFLSSRYTETSANFNVPRQKLFIQLPYLSNQSTKLKNEMNTLINKYFPQLHVQWYFRSTLTIGSFFSIKERTSLLLRSYVVYEYKCHCCQQRYMGSTARQLFMRCSEHLGRSFRTNQFVSRPSHSSIRDHCEIHDHPIHPDNFSVIGNNNNKSDLRILESLFIHKYRPTLNDMQSAVPLNVC